MTTIETHKQATNGKLQNASLLTPFPQLSEKLLTLRMALNISQSEMGKLLGVSHGSISLWERGHSPHGPNKAMLCRFLDQNWSEIIGRRQDGKQYIIHRTGMRGLRFTGQFLGDVEDHGFDDHRDENVVLSLYRTAAGKWVAVELREQRAPDGNTQSAKVCENVEQVYEFFGFTPEAQELYATAGIEPFEDID